MLSGARRAAADRRLLEDVAMYLRALLTSIWVVAGSALAWPLPVQGGEQAEVRLIWPDEDHVRPPGRYLLQGSYQILDPAISFGKAGFIINNTPYDASTYEGDKFAFRPTFRAGEYLIEAYIVDTSGQLLPGEAHRLYVRDDAPQTPPEAPEPASAPPQEDSAPAAPAGTPGPAFAGEHLKAYIEFDAPREGQSWGSFLNFPPDEADRNLQPTVSWQGNRFEAFLKYEKPAAEIWDESRKTIAKLRWDIQYRVFGNISNDHQSLERITFEYKANCRLDNDKLWEYYEGHYALTNVPGGGRMASSNNPLANTSGGYLVEYRIDGSDRSTLDHVLEFSYRHGYPAYPETEYQISSAMLTRVNFTFNGW